MNMSECETLQCHKFFWMEHCTLDNGAPALSTVPAVMNSGTAGALKIRVNFGKLADGEKTTQNIVNINCQ